MVTDISTTWVSESACHFTLIITSAQVVETSVATTENSPFQDYTHPDDQSTLSHVTPGSNHLPYEMAYSVKLK